MKKYLYILIIGLTTNLLFTSCADLLDVRIPEDTVLEDEAINDFRDIEQILLSGYDVMANVYNGQSQRIAELLADGVDSRFDDANGFVREIYTRNTNFFNSEVGGFYRNPYFAIHRVNTVLENLDNVEIADQFKVQYEAEAKFIRGLAHFELARFFAQPYGYTSDNSHLGIPLRRVSGTTPAKRATVEETYQFILEDLEFAAEFLPDNSRINRITANKMVAHAFLARVKFFQNDFEGAIEHCNVVITGNRYNVSSNANSRFAPTTGDTISNITGARASSEAIFTGVSTNYLGDNRSGIMTGSFRSNVATEPFLKISASLYNLATQNPADLRAAWFGSAEREDGSIYYTIAKYNNDFQDMVIISFPEILLTRAEASAELDINLNEAISDIDRIRTNRGLPNLSPISSREQIIEQARLQRQIELSIEGDRVFQLKRRGAKGENILIRGAAWNCPGMILQFPATEGDETFDFNDEGGCN